MKTKIVFILILTIALLTMSHFHRWSNHSVLKWDAFGYHNYLPAVFIYHDITSYLFLDHIDSVYQPASVPKYGLYPVRSLESSKSYTHTHTHTHTHTQAALVDSSRLCNQYPVGVSIFQLPGFLIAHAWTVWSGKHFADGYSKPYQQATAYSTLLFGFLGLIFLFLLIRRYFSENISLLTVLLIAGGTNITNYWIIETGYSHVYLFFLYAVMLYITDSWFRTPRWHLAALIGLVIGLATITRPVDIFICLIPVLWIFSVRDKWEFIQTHRKHIMFLLLSAFVMTWPQLIYWKYVTGYWFYYSYSGVDYFEFDRFRLIHGLISFRKGWFVYTPLALIAFIGIFHFRLQGNLLFYKRVFWFYFIPVLYLVFSWHNWFYGWSYGCRALIQTLPLLAIPLANLLQKMVSFNLLKKFSVSVILVFIFFLNIFQNDQYNRGIIHGASMNETLYWSVFLKNERPPNFDQVLKLQEEIDWAMGW